MQVLNAIKSLKNSTGRIDQLTNKIIKLGNRAYAHYYSYLFTLFLNLDNIPCEMTIGTVFPLIKNTKKSKDDLSNYRPIALLPATTKLLEKVIHNNSINGMKTQ